MKELLKTSHAAMFQSRTVGSTHTVQAYEKLMGIAGELDDIVHEERVEREIRLGAFLFFPSVLHVDIWSVEITFCIHYVRGSIYMSPPNGH
jgi:hypothetical protein